MPQVNLGRRVLYWTLLSLLTCIYIAALPCLILPRRFVLGIVKSYLASMFWILRHVIGLSWQVRGHIPSSTSPVLIASKHQSALETLILQYELDDPVIVIKDELLHWPVIGWVFTRLGHIGADRSGDLANVRRLLRLAMAASCQGRCVVIFPEGTRREIGTGSDYKAGVELLYAALRVPCVPVAVNSGRVWSAKALCPSSGQVVIEFLPAIEAGLSRAEFGRKLQNAIEEATANLLELPNQNSVSRSSFQRPMDS